MKEKLINMLNGTRNTAHVLRTIVGAYVVYICGKVAVDYFRTDEVTLPLMLGAAVVALCGLAISLLGLWALIKGYSIEYKGTPPWTMTEDETDETEQLPDGDEEEESENAEATGESEDPEESEESQ